MRFLNYDGPVMSGLGKIADLIILNLMTLLFCIPVVTIGASVTACHYVALKIRRGEGYVLRNFWKSFRENLRQSTVIWFIVTVCMTVSVYIALFFNVSGTLASVSRVVLCVTAIFWAFIACWVYPLQSKFVNTIKNTIKNSFLLSFRYLFRTILMVMINLLPLVLVLVVGYKALSVVLLFGFSVPAYLCAMLYDKKFEELEQMILKNQAEEKGEAEEIFTIEEGTN